MSKKYRQVMQDQVKLHVIQWATENPQWSPESLIAVTKMFLKLYGLRNRYLPPDFKKDEETEVPVEDKLQRVESSSNGEANAG